MPASSFEAGIYTFYLKRYAPKVDKFVLAKCYGGKKLFNFT